MPDLPAPGGDVSALGGAARRRPRPLAADQSHATAPGRPARGPRRDRPARGLDLGARSRAARLAPALRARSPRIARRRGPLRGHSARTPASRATSRSTATASSVSTRAGSARGRAALTASVDRQRELGPGLPALVIERCDPDAQQPDRPRRRVLAQKVARHASHSLGLVDRLGQGARPRGGREVVEADLDPDRARRGAPAWTGPSRAGPRGRRGCARVRLGRRRRSRRSSRATPRPPRAPRTRASRLRTAPGAPAMAPSAARSAPPARRAPPRPAPRWSRPPSPRAPPPSSARPPAAVPAARPKSARTPARATARRTHPASRHRRTPSRRGGSARSPRTPRAGSRRWISATSRRMAACGDSSPVSSR